MYQRTIEEEKVSKIVKRMKRIKKEELICDQCEKVIYSIKASDDFKIINPSYYWIELSVKWYFSNDDEDRNKYHLCSGKCLRNKIQSLNLYDDLFINSYNNTIYIDRYVKLGSSIKNGFINYSNSTTEIEEDENED